MMRIPDLRVVWQQARFRRVVKAFLFGFVALVLASALAVPPLLRWAVETQGSQALGRKLTVEHVGFNPLTLTASVGGLQIMESDGKTLFLRIGKAEASVAAASVWYRGLVMDGVRLEQPTLRLVRLDDNRFNFSDIVERLRKPSSEKPDTGKPLRFSINNIELTGGQIDFDDRPAKRVHHIGQLAVGIPFVSNLPARVQRYVTPRIEARVNGSDFRLSGQLKPFADHREAGLDLVLQSFDITQYLAYVPASLPVTIERARLGTDIHVVWSDGDKGHASSLSIHGNLRLSDLQVKDGSHQPVYEMEALTIDIERLEPLASPLVARFKSISVDAPHAYVARNASGVMNLVALFASGKHGGAASPASAPAHAGDKPEAAPQVFVERLSVNKGAVSWRDGALPSPFSFDLKPIDIQVDKFDLAGGTSAALKFKGQGSQGESVALSARFNPRDASASGHLNVTGISLESLRPYYSHLLGRMQLRGLAGLEGDFDYDKSKGRGVEKLSAVALTLQGFTAGDPRLKTAWINLPDTRADAIGVDFSKHQVVLGNIVSKDALLRLQRDKHGTLNLLSLLPPGQASGSAPPPAHEKGKPTPWDIRLGGFALTNWGLHLDDHSGSAPVAMDVAALNLSIKDWSSRVGVQAAVDLGARVNKAGALKVSGRVGTEPLKGSLKVDVRTVDFLAVQPYVDNLYRILVTRGNVSMRGDLAFDLSDAKQPDIRYAGSFAIADFNSLDRLNNTDFMRWKRFAFDAVRVQTRPLAFSSSEIRLEDFYTRLILDAEGRLNVRELASGEEAPAAPDAKPAPASPPAAASGVAGEIVRGGGSLPQIRIDNVVLVDGHINYTDHFVKPNYEANLLALNGRLSGLSSDPSSVAALDVKASLDGAAPVSVTGELNPFRQDSYLDIKADVHDVDLTGVSTYATKYVGYGIDKGKFSMAVQYKVRDRKLSADNHLKLDQLTFGQKVDSPSATKLPVLFAVALLKDRHGVIDINLPISGSLDDPQFSVGSVIGKVIVNLLEKAATAPFALLGAIFDGGSEELSYLDFAPGSAALSKPGEEKISTLVKALVDRPSLRLEVSGRADPVSDVVGIKRVWLDSKLRALKAEQMVKRGGEVGRVDSLVIEPAEYPALLQKVYESEKIDARPRNALGLLKSLPADEMEKIILNSHVVSEADLQALASQRAQAVRARLIDKTGVEPDRVFLLGSGHATESTKDRPAAARVEFSLK